MPLECVMFCLDTSNYMRNGDLHPTRLSAQQQSVSSLARFKLEDNAESGVGLLTMAGYKVDVHLSPSRDIHKLLTVLKSFKAQGAIDIISTLKISQLTLRNRSNKHQRQRIIMYIASPINLTEEQIITVGRELKKNAIALDVVLFGLESLENGNVQKAQLLIDTVQNAGNSHLVTYYDPALIDITTLPQDVQNSININTTNASLTDVVIRSPLGRNVQTRPVVAPPAAVPAVNAGNTNLGPAALPGTTASMVDDDLDEDLLAAMELSRQDFEQSQPQQQPQETQQNNQTVPGLDEDDDIDPDLLAAIQLSLEADAKAIEDEKNATKMSDDAAADKEDDFNALLEAVSGGMVTSDENKDTADSKDGEKDDDKQ